MRIFQTSILFLVLAYLLSIRTATAVDHTRVVRGVDSEAVQLFTPDAHRVRKLFNASLLQLTNTKDIASAWKTIVLPTDRIGIKINTQPGPVMSSRLSLVETIVHGLERAGVPHDHIVVFDRYAMQMEIAGYAPNQNPNELTVVATVPNVGYDPNASLTFPIPGKLIWGDLDFKKDPQRQLANDKTLDTDDQLSTKSYFSKIVTQQVDKIINVAVPITDPYLGIYGCELNVTLSLIDNFRRLQHSSFTREDSITSIFSNPIIRKKCVLHVLDALIAQYAGGPQFDPSYCWTPKAIYISRDAVALDSLALKIINQQRPSAELAPIKEQAAYIQAAADEGLGVADLSNIEIIDAQLSLESK